MAGENHFINIYNRFAGAKVLGGDREEQIKDFAQLVKSLGKQNITPEERYNAMQGFVSTYEPGLLDVSRIYTKELEALALLVKPEVFPGDDNAFEKMYQGFIIHVTRKQEEKLSAKEQKLLMSLGYAVSLEANPDHTLGSEREEPDQSKESQQSEEAKVEESSQAALLETEEVKSEEARNVIPAQDASSSSEAPKTTREKVRESSKKARRPEKAPQTIQANITQHINTPSKRSLSPLQMAIQAGNYALAQDLGNISAANLTYADDHGNTALHYAVTSDAAAKAQKDAEIAQSDAIRAGKDYFSAERLFKKLDEEFEGLKAEFLKDKAKLSSFVAASQQDDAVASSSSVEDEALEEPNGNADILNLIVREKEAEVIAAQKENQKALENYEAAVARAKVASEKAKLASTPYDFVHLFSEKFEAVPLLDHQNANGETALHLAVRNGDLDVVRFLTSNQAKLRFTTKTERTVLHTAFEPETKFNIDVISHLMSTPTLPLNVRDGAGNTPFHLALQNKEYIKCLNAEEEVSEISYKIFRDSLNALNLNELNSSDESLLHIAASNKDFPNDLFNELVDKIESEVTFKHLINLCDSKGHSPLYYALRSGDVAKVDALKTKGAKLTKHEPKEALEYALIRQHSEIAIKLINEFNVSPDFSIDFNKNIQGKVTNSILGSTSSVASAAFAKALRVRNPLIKPGDTPLHYAARTGNMALAEACLKMAPDIVNRTNEKGKTALYYTVSELNSELAQFLVQNGAREVAPKVETKFFSSEKPIHPQPTCYQKATKRKFDTEGQLTQFFAPAADCSGYGLSEKQAALKEARQEKIQSKLEAAEPASKRRSVLRV